MFVVVACSMVVVEGADLLGNMALWWWWWWCPWEEGEGSVSAPAMVLLFLLYCKNKNNVPITAARTGIMVKATIAKSGLRWWC